MPGVLSRLSVSVVLALLGASGCALEGAEEDDLYDVQAGGGKTGTTFVVDDGVYLGTTTASVSNPPAQTWVVATCYQDGSPVIFNRLPVDSAGRAVLSLGPTDGYIVGMGGADCDAEAKYWHTKRQRWVTLATTTFY